VEHNCSKSSKALSEITMKKFLFTLSLAALTFGGSASAQNTPKAEEAAAVQATVRNYIEAYYLGDAPRMLATLDSHYLKHMIHGSIPKGEDRLANGGGSSQPWPRRSS
jgi:hypothetical protein